MIAHSMPGHLIRRLQQKSGQVFARHMAAAGIDVTSVQFAALDAIIADPGIDQATVAARIGYDRATIGGVIDRLDSKGYVTRTTSRRDRRAREVRPTPEGQSAFAALAPVVRALQDEILAPLSAQERQTFMNLARKAVTLDAE